MDITLALVIGLAAAFFIAGFVDSIAGGGGLITMPSLLLAGVPAHYALGTGKLASGLGSLTAVFAFARNRFLIWKILPISFLSSFLGAAIGSWIALQVESELMGRIMVFMLPVGLLLSLLCGGLTLDGEPLPRRGLYPKLITIGLIIGAYDGFFGPGAGSFFLIALHVLIKMDLVKASANAKVFNLASNLGAICTFATGGTVIYLLAIPCAIASIIGNQIGAKFAMRIGARFVRYVLYVVLALLLATLVYRFFIQAA